MNDLGMGRAFDVSMEFPMGWAIPSNRRALLGLIPSQCSPVLHIDKSGNWTAHVEHYTISSAEVLSINRTIASYARRIVVASSREEITRVAESAFANATEYHDVMLGWEQITTQARVVHEFDWHRLATLTNVPADPLNPLINVQEWDIATLAKGWCPPLIMPTNLPDYPSGIDLIGATLTLSVEEIPASQKRCI